MSRSDVPRRLKLSPLQREITMMLEEGGAVTVGTVVATLKPHGLANFGAQVDELAKLGLIRKDSASLILTEQGRKALRT